jgi:cell wall-associated NlpC family hydrolase
MKKIYLLLIMVLFLITSCGATSYTKRLRNNIIKTAKRYKGKRYVWGGTGPYKFDCSGYTQYICKKNGLKIPRNSRVQSKFGKYIKRKNLKKGDLVFFDTSKNKRGYVNHVGIYLGHNKFIHASSAKRKVVITSLNGTFHGRRFKWGRRIFGS